MAQLVREHNINDNLLFNWRSLYLKGQLLPRISEPVMLPVTLSQEPAEISSTTASGAGSLPGEALSANWFLLPVPFG